MSGTASHLGKYELRGTLGKGAMGVVHDGWDPLIHRRVAIKTTPLPDIGDLESVAALDRFKREAQAAGRLTHPNIIGVYDYGETAGLAYIVMEFVDGHTLKQMIDSGERFPLSEVRRIIGDILAALTYSHSRGVVHRDIKPGNVMVTREGLAKIADFGIARIESASLTQAGTILGTPAYMSPEQFMGQTIDSRTDIYSTGALLYQLVTGDRPFDGSLTTIMHKVLHAGPPPAPSELSVAVPPALDAVIARAMARRPDARYTTAAAFALALNQAIPGYAEPAEPLDDTAADATAVWERTYSNPGTLPQPAPPSPPPQTRRTSTPLLILGGLAALGAAGAALWFFLPRGPTVPPLVPAIASAPPSVAPPAVPPRTAGDIRAALAAVLPTLDCTLVRADVAEDGSATVTGLAGTGMPETLLHKAVATAAPAAVTWQVTPFTPPYCPALDLIRTAAPPASGLQIKLGANQATLQDSAIIPVDVTFPGFTGHLQLDYLQNDGTVAHLVPTSPYPDRLISAGEHIELGRSAPNFPGWQVGPPFGTDMILAIATTTPLFSTPRPDTEPTSAYLHDLQTAIADLRRQGGTVTAIPLLLETRP